MADRKPLVVVDGQVQELANSDDLYLKLRAEHEALKERFDQLVHAMVEAGIDLPESVTCDMHEKGE